MSTKGDVDTLLNFFFRLNDIKLQTQLIENEKMALTHVQGTQQTLLEAQLASSKQTLEVIKLTRAVVWLTIILVILGLAQLLVTVFDIKIRFGSG